MLSVNLLHSLSIFPCLFLFGAGATAQRTMTGGLSIIDSPGSESSGHAGSDLPISVEISGDGTFSADAANPSSTLSTHYISLNVYLVSSETNANFTVSNSTSLLTGESGSTVKHLNWPIPTCISAGYYNLTFYELALINGQTYYTITPISIPVQNPSQSSDCSSIMNALESQPQEDSPPATSPLGSGSISSSSSDSSSSDPVFVTITLDGTQPFEFPTVTRTVTPTSPPTTVVLISMETEIMTFTVSGQALTSQWTETYTSTAVVQSSDLDGFVPVGGAAELYRTSFWTFLSSLYVVILVIW